MIPYYDKDGITIYCGDCLEVMPTLQTNFDAIIADWPYGTTACSWDSVIPLSPLWVECKRLIKSSGAIVLTAVQPFTSILVLSNVEWFRVEWIWEKLRGTNYLNANRDPMKNHESIVVFAKGYPTYNPQMRDGKPYVVTSGKVGGFIKDKSVSGNITQNNGGRYPLTVNRFKHPTDKLHPTQKPLALMSYFVRTYSNPGDLILDNTMGSGTTLVAARQEGRRAIGIDISEDYCKIAIERLRQPSFFSLPTESAVPAKPKLEQTSFL